MIKLALTPKERRRLQYRLRHPKGLNPKVLPRLQCVLWRASGKKPKEIARDLVIDRNTVTNWTNCYQDGGEEALLTLNYPGNHRYLNERQERKLARAIDRKMFGRLKELETWVESKFKVTYSERGLGKLIRRLGFVKNVAGIVPAQANPVKQRAFLKEVPRLA